ncbi:unnamed protein product, partial [Prorocentrum cordatum]
MGIWPFLRHVASDFVPHVQVYGLWDFLTQWRDQAVVGHLKNFSPSSVVVYLLLAVFLMWNLGNVLEPHRCFFCRDGVLSTMSAERVVTLDGDLIQHVQAFLDIRDKDAAWTWLTYVVSGVVLDDSSDLRKSNYMPGQVQLRAQIVKDKSHDQCIHKEYLSDSITCAAHYYESSSAFKSTLPGLDTYWANLSGLAGRGDSNPSRYVDEAPGDTARIEGLQQMYDTSGYIVEYDMQGSPLSEVRQAYLADMEELKGSWLNDQTRAIHVSFVLYNGNYDYWVSNHFLLEMPPNGVVIPSVDPQVFKPIALDYGDGVETFVLDTCLLILAVFYVSVWQFLAHYRATMRYNQELRTEIDKQEKANRERGRKEMLPPEICQFKPSWFKLEEKKKEKTLWHIVLHGNVVIDTGVTALLIATYVMRYVVPWVMYGSTARYREQAKQGLIDSESEASMFSWAVILQSLVISGVIWRWYGFLKLNRYVFLIYKTISTVVATYSKFGMIMVPMLLTFVFFAHQIWRPYAIEYKSFLSSLASYLVRLVGDKESARMADVERPITVFFSVSSFFVVKLVLIQSWIASLVQTYQRVRVTSGYKPEDKERRLEQRLFGLARAWTMQGSHRDRLHFFLAMGDVNLLRRAFLRGIGCDAANQSRLSCQRVVAVILEHDRNLNGATDAVFEGHSHGISNRWGFHLHRRARPPAQRRPLRFTFKLKRYSYHYENLLNTSTVARMGVEGRWRATELLMREGARLTRNEAKQCRNDDLSDFARHGLDVCIGLDTTLAMQWRVAAQKWWARVHLQAAGGAAMDSACVVIFRFCRRSQNIPRYEISALHKVALPLTTPAPGVHVRALEQLAVLGIVLVALLVWFLPWFCIQRRWCTRWFQRWLSRRLGLYFVFALAVNLAFATCVMASLPDLSVNDLFFAFVHLVGALSDQLEIILKQ